MTLFRFLRDWLNRKRAGRELMEGLERVLAERSDGDVIERAA